MWVRNLVFLGVVAVGAASLVGGLFPPRVGSRASSADPGRLPPEYQAVVDDVDRHFRHQWANAKLTPAPAAPALAVARRLALGLCGTVPSLQEIRRLAADPENGGDQAWLTDLFQDRRFTDYFAERLARVFVGTEDGPFVVFRRRRLVSWLSDELLHNRPYDVIVRSLIADEGLWTDRPGTNFVTVTANPDGNVPNPERLAARVARAFLGVRLDCAQCHDHPFQSWKQADFQGLAAYFGQVHTGLTGIYDGSGEYEAARGKTGKPRTVAPCVPFARDLCNGSEATPASRRQQLAEWVTDGRNVAFAQATVNRVWGLLFGRPLVEPVDDLPSAGELHPVLKRLAEDFGSHGYDLHRLIRIMAATEVFRLDSAIDGQRTNHDRLWAAFPITRLRPEQVAGALSQAASLETIDRNSPLLERILALLGENEFVKRYGDAGDDEFTSRSGTIPQRLLLMNGKLVQAKTEEGLLSAAPCISLLAPDDAAAVETAYLVVLTRRPTPEEAEHFERGLTGTTGDERKQRISDLFWTLMNSTEFSWNH
jgi:hypothetical protein